MKTPVYIINEKKLQQNLEIFKNIKDQTGCKIILALKAYSTFETFPLMRQYLDGCTASSLHEALLGKEEFQKETHIYSPGFQDDEIEIIAQTVDHITFNSIAQLNKYKDLVKRINPNIEIGLRLNPEHSEAKQSIYNPCAPYSRFGVTKAEFSAVNVDGFLVHNLCGQGADSLERTLNAIEEKFGDHLHNAKWLDIGGGHMATKEDYDTQKLINLINTIQNKYNLQIILEPGEAMVLNAGILKTTVLDIMKNEKNIAIIDSSATAHMPDVLEMPYRPNVVGDSENNPHHYRIGGATCLSGDIIGDYAFETPLKIGDTITFLDMAQYTMVKNTTFNGLRLPSIAIERLDGTTEVVRTFDYSDFKSRLS